MYHAIFIKGEGFIMALTRGAFSYVSCCFPSSQLRIFIFTWESIATPIMAQELLIALHSHVTPSVTRRTIWSAGVVIWSAVYNTSLTQCTIALISPSQFSTIYRI